MNSAAGKSKNMYFWFWGELCLSEWRHTFKGSQILLFRFPRKSSILLFELLRAPHNVGKPYKCSSQPYQSNPVRDGSLCVNDLYLLPWLAVVVALLCVWDAISAFSPFYVIKTNKVKPGNIKYPSGFLQVISQMCRDKVQPLICAKVPFLVEELCLNLIFWTFKMILCQ